MIALGYAGWGGGQLEGGARNIGWQLKQPQILFDQPYEKRLDAAASLLGIDLNLVSPDAGYS